MKRSLCFTAVWKLSVGTGGAMDHSWTLERIGELGLLAVVRGESRTTALEVTAALVEGGVLGIEVTFTTPEAGKVLEDLNQEYGERILLGAGTIVESWQVEQAVASGAVFLVSPGCDPDLVPLMLEADLAVMPGILTPTELMLARRLGVEVFKLFPGSAGGPSYLKALLGPFPDAILIPTGGVSEENVHDWFAAGAFAVGAGGALAPAAIKDDRHREEVVARARSFAQAARDAARATAG
jgi:2-dehydro-3-deoxyphosphogluconate aldolase / (4S)-4-hydroxy-2-oxoglutarate aldolase